MVLRSFKVLVFLVVLGGLLFAQTWQKGQTITLKDKGMLYQGENAKSYVLQLKSAYGQKVNIFEIRDSKGRLLFGVDKDGKIVGKIGDKNSYYTSLEIDTLLEDYVLYSGATQDLDLGDNGLIANSVKVKELAIDDGGTKPTCDAEHRGLIWIDFASGNNSDSVEICIKTGQSGEPPEDTYAWKTLIYSE